MPDLDQLLDTLVTDVGARTRAPGAPTAIKRAHRRRTKAAAAVAVMVAATAAVIAGSAVTVPGLDDDRSAPPLEQPEPTKNPGLTTPLIAPESLLDLRELGFHLERAPDLALSGAWAVDRDWQSIEVQVLDGESNGRRLNVKVNYEGRPMSNIPGTNNGEPVTVNGVPGTYAEHHGDGFHTAVLAWEYAPDSWARVDAGWTDAELPSDLRSKMLTAAEAVRPGGKTLLLPVRFGSAPASLPAIANAHRVDFLKDEGESGWTMYVRVDDDVMVSATTAVAPDECLEFTYRGHRGCVVPSDGGGTAVGIHHGDVDVTYEFDPGRELPVEDMKRLLAGATVASTPFDPTTWFDLRTALGG
ncbi:MAG TPA: hypothetical protein VFV76_10585 [Actinomycetes bacterium]|nr:hypothetical protein [Actinomycetes bacterium]